MTKLDIKLTPHEEKILVAIREGWKFTGGAATNAALEYLKGMGYITGYLGAPPQITQKGREALKAVLYSRSVDAAKAAGVELPEAAKAPVTDKDPTSVIADVFGQQLKDYGNYPPHHAACEILGALDDAGFVVSRKPSMAQVAAGIMEKPVTSSKDKPPLNFKNGSEYTPTDIRVTHNAMFHRANGELWKITAITRLPTETTTGLYQIGKFPDCLKRELIFGADIPDFIAAVGTFNPAPEKPAEGASHPKVHGKELRPGQEFRDPFGAMWVIETADIKNDRFVFRPKRRESAARIVVTASGVYNHFVS